MILDSDLFSVAGRVFTLSVSVLLSFLSLAKTGYNVNKPDPDPDRKAAQTKANARQVHMDTLRECFPGI